MKKELTSKQKKVFRVIKGFINKKGFSPTFKELRRILSQEGMKLKSNGSVAQYLDVLEEKELIQRFSKARGIRILDESIKNFVALPLLGQADCGEALSYANDIAEDHINISKEYIKGNKRDYFFIKASGNSMDKSGIKNGDLVLVKKVKEEPNENQDVVAVINGLGTIKKFKKINGIPILVPNSTDSKYQPIILHSSDNINISGKVIKTFKFSTMEK